MNSDNWVEYKFSDFVCINPQVDLINSNEYSFVEMKDLNPNNKFVFPSAKRKFSNGSRFLERDTLFARITPCLENGKICQVKNLHNGKGFGSTEFLIFRGKPGISDIDFVYYLSRFSEVRRFAEINMSGTSGRQRTSKDAFTNLKLTLPPLPEQRTIAGILSALDDKIELNCRMNATLENLAQILFKHWFIDNPKIEKWEEKSLDEIANYLNGLALQKYPPMGDDYLPVIKIAQLRKNNSSDSDKANLNLDPAYIVEDGDILFSWSGSLEVVIWCGSRGALNQHLFKVTSQEYPKWFYYLWTKYHLPEFQAIAAGKATTMGHIQRHHLTEAKVLVPDKSEISKMSEIMNPLLGKIIATNIESRTLIELRDTLLPRLMSGQVRVSTF